MENTKIEWANHTFNPWMGCTKVSPACKNCYAERDMDQRFGRVQWGDMGTRVLTSDANWRKPLKWNREAAENGVRARVFCASLADVFEDWRGPMMFAGTQPVYVGKDFRASSGPDTRATMDDVRARLFHLIDATPHLDWLLLTKRPQNIRRMWVDTNSDGSFRCNFASPTCDGGYRHNVWIGTSVENQEQADKRIPGLLECRELSPVLFLSCEPLLGSVDLRPALWLEDQYFGFRGVGPIRSIDWVIAGGESGPNARPSHPDWFRSLRDQCQAAAVPFLFKQWGEWGPNCGDGDETGSGVFLPDGRFIDPNDLDAIDAPQLSLDELTIIARVGKKKAGRVLDGREWTEFPEVVECSN